MTAREMLDDLRSPRKKKVILDTDTFNEVDDQYALAYCYISENIDLLSVNAAPFLNWKSTSYNDGMEKSYAEAKKILSLCDPYNKTPVFRGATTTVTESGSPVDSPAVQNIIDTVSSSPDPVYILGIAASTNIASAIKLAPHIRENMCVIWLGSNALDADGIDEFNLYQDYAAGQYLMDSGVPLLLCPAWCVVSELYAKREEITAISSANPVCGYLASITAELWKGVPETEPCGKIIWDIAAPAIVDIPDCAEIEVIPAPIFTDERKYAFDPTRHEMLYLKKIHRDTVMERTWSVIAGNKKTEA